MSPIEIAVPDIGDFSEVEVIEILVKPGDDISLEQSLITVESDKASMEIPSPAAGRLQELKVKVGDKVAKGTVIGILESSEAAAPAGTPAAPATGSAATEAATEAATGAATEAATEAATGSATGSAAGSAAEAAAPVAAGAAGGGSGATPAQATADSGESGSRAGGEPRGAGITQVQVPDIGDFDEVEVIEVLVAAGDTVALEQSLITVESDKASMEIPSGAAGKVTKVLVKVGDKVAKGTPIASIDVGGAAKPATGAAAASPSDDAAPDVPGSPGQSPGEPSAATPAAGSAGGAPEGASGGAEPSPTVSSAPSPSDSPSPGAAAGSTVPAGAGAASRAHPVPADLRGGQAAMKPHASPSVRLFARELGVDLTLVKGTGPKERITADDVRGFVKRVVSQAADGAPAVPAAAPPGSAGLGLIPWPKVDFAKYGDIEVKPLARIRKIASANLHRNWVMIPHVTNHEDADITDLEAFRLALNAENAGSGTKLTMLAFLIKACIAGLKKFPEFNTSLEGDSLVYKKYFHIGFAADTPNGLVVPVIRDADRKGLFDIAAEMSELARKARDGKLSPADMQGGTFSISSLGGIGGTYFTPIINAPEVAILGVCRASTRPVWNAGSKAFEPRLILPLSLSWDHRVIDGAAAARFNTYLAQLLGDFRRVNL